MRAVVVAGARPNFMKVKPVVEALEARHVDVTLVHTGKHVDLVPPPRNNIDQVHGLRSE